MEDKNEISSQIKKENCKIIPLRIIGICGLLLGIVIYFNTQKSNAKADVNPQEMYAYNSKFEMYEGRQNGENVKVLINTINSTNATHERYIEIKGTYRKITDIKDTDTYFIRFHYDAAYGFINTVWIDDYNESIE